MIELGAAIFDGRPEPSIGDRFVVVAVINAIDVHWGECRHITLIEDECIAISKTDPESAARTILNNLDPDVVREIAERLINERYTETRNN